MTEKTISITARLTIASAAVSTLASATVLADVGGVAAAPAWGVALLFGGVAFAASGLVLATSVWRAIRPEAGTAAA